MQTSPGQQFRNALKQEKPLQIVGVINAYVALMAQKNGFRALYLSGAGVANSSHGLPDLALTTLNDVLEDARRIISASSLPLLVDIDTGWGSTLMTQRTIREMVRAGVAAVHIEDQTTQKRCGHLAGKQVVSTKQMVDRIKAAVDARSDPSFVIMARTDAFAVEGLEKTIERGLAYRDAGADALFPEALHTLEQFKTFKSAVQIPVLANLTEFGKTPLFTLQELSEAHIDMALYPLSVNRAMNLAATRVLYELRQKGTQRALLDEMQTRDELYHFLNYGDFEKKLESTPE